MKILAVLLGLCFTLSLPLKKGELTVVSPAFEHEKDIPEKYTCQGDNVHPALTVQHIPAEAKTLAIVFYDQDAPGGYYVHWIAWNIAPKETIEENSLPGISGINAKGKTGYFGPCPPHGTHFYNFEVYALDAELKLTSDADERTLKQAMQEHIVGYGKLTGRYKKK